MRKATIVGKHSANGLVIYEARRAKRLTQTELGRAAGVGYRHIIRLENGEHLPSGDVRDALAAALGVDPSTIQSRDGDLEEVGRAAIPFRAGSRRGAPRSGGATPPPNGEVKAA